MKIIRIHRRVRAGDNDRLRFLICNELGSFFISLFRFFNLFFSSPSDLRYNKGRVRYHNCANYRHMPSFSAKSSAFKSSSVVDQVVAKRTTV